MKSVFVLLLKADFLRNMPPFESVKELREYLLEQHRDDLLLASDTTFRFGYFGEGDRGTGGHHHLRNTSHSIVIG